MEDLQDYEYCHLDEVHCEFHNTSTSHSLLRQLTGSLLKSRSVSELNSEILKAIYKLESLDTFKICDVKVLPGTKLDSAIVSFALQDNKWWTMSVGVTADNEGGKSEASAILRNLRSKADHTAIKIEYKPNSKTYGYQFLHHDRLYLPGKWEAFYSVKQGNEEIDVNLKENNYSGSFCLRSVNGKHRVEVGRSIRTNSVRVENASLAMIKSALPVNAKNYLSYSFLNDSRDNPQTPKSGSYLKFVNEIAYGNDNKFCKVDMKLNSYFGLTSAVVLQTSIAAGLFPYWNLSKISINDRFRMRFVKGFNTIGTREPAGNSNIANKYQVNGDHLGSYSNLVVEGKIHFYDCVGLHDMGLVPFVYGSVMCEDPVQIRNFNDYFRDKVRASAGFGLGWNGSFGRIEFAYTTKVMARPGDVTSEFQVLFSD